MLCDFLETYRSEIMALTEEKSSKLAGPLPTSGELKMGLPLFYNHLISYLKNPNSELIEKEIVKSAADHGKELLRLNYTLSHVVHSYGAICQAVTEFAQRRNANIDTREFNNLNLCLDIAIASAVSEFQFRSVQASEEREIQHLGFLVHEIRNALSSATVAHEMIQQGIVGTSGSTARVLGENLVRMRNLVDRSLSEVRMRADPVLHIEKFYLNVLVDQILLTARSEAAKRKQILHSEIKQGVELETDRQLLLSAIANLVQNAIKYSRDGGRVTVRAGVSSSNIIIEVEDECGGIPEDLMKNIFKPFVSGTLDKSGLGLGLTIVQKAISLLQGKITVIDHSGRGCAFLIDIPQKLVPMTPGKPTSGEDSAQPKQTFSKL